ncbi:MAG: cupin domain-containing protein [Proteobacteria bacterium]|nr:cupin domain-containing protein [Pseudomonadota bacterium]
MLEKQIAQKIRVTRKAKRLSLQELADRTNLSKAMLSKIENCKVSPTIKTLSKVAKGLETPLLKLFDEDQLPSNPISIVKKKDRKKIVSPRRAYGPYRYFTLSSLEPPTLMEPFNVKMYPDSGKSPDLVGHLEEEIIFIISGSVKFTYGDEEYILNPGDTLHFDGQVPHKVAPHGKEIVEILSVISSPLS